MNAMYQELLDFEKTRVDENTFADRVSRGEIIILNGRQKSVMIGKGLGLKINTSIGLNSVTDYNTEIKKIKAIEGHSTCPDTMMDLSTVKIISPLYNVIQDIIGCPVGTIPYYTCFNSRYGINDTELLETIEAQAESGVSFMTMHFTASLSLAKKSKSRCIPVISRGGSLLLRDIRINNRSENVLNSNIEKIIPILKRYNVAVSLGTTFRPSVQTDALDATHCEELKIQEEYVRYLRRNGVQAMMEGIGHIAMNKIPDYVSLLRSSEYVPFMPLGPIVSDRTKGQDHITSAIGASYMASLEGADIINSITREEHTGGIPSSESILEALDASATVVKIVNDCRFPVLNKRTDVLYENCLGMSTGIGCSRCGNECPFIWNDSERNRSVSIH